MLTETNPQARHADYGVILKYKDLTKCGELIKQELRGHIQMCIKDCGLTVDDVSEYQALLDNIERDGIEPHTEAVEYYIFELFDAVLGMPHKYLDDVSFFDAVCEYEDFPEAIPN